MGQWRAVAWLRATLGPHKPHIEIANGGASLLVGLIAGFFTDEVRQSQGLADSFEKVSWPATFFWLLLIFQILASATIALLAKWDAADDEAQRKALGERTEALHIATKVQDVLRYCEEALAEIKDHPTLRTDRALHIRVFLHGMAMLAWLHDNDRHARYAANVMYFSDAQSGPPTALKFNDVPPGDLAGYLHLDRQLSATAHDASEDPLLEPFELPVPKSVRNSAGKLRVLPGAPRVFLNPELRLDIFADSADLVGYSEREGAFSAAAIRQLKEYLQSPPGQQVRSFVSFPLVPSARSAPIGVLNLHRDRPGILSKNAAEFAEATTLYTLRVAVLVARHLKSRQN